MPLTGNPKKDLKELHKANKKKRKGKKRSRKQILAMAMEAAKNKPMMKKHGKMMGKMSY